MDDQTKNNLLEKLKELDLIKRNKEIQEHSFIEFENITKGIDIDENNLDQLSKHLFGIHQKDRFETVLYYRFLMAENFSQLINDIDKHTEYNLPEYYIRINGVFDAFYRIELTAKFINFIECLAAIYTVSQEWKKAFSDQEFEDSLVKIINDLSVNFSLLKKIRNKLHHAYYVRLQKSSIYKDNEKINCIAFDKMELLRKVDNFTEEEMQVLESYDETGIINIKPLVVNTFQEYSTFLMKYQTLVEKLLQRLTGTSFHMTL